jgi:hypothetical protein
MSIAPWATPRFTHCCGLGAGEEAVGEAAGEAVAAADAVFDLEVLEVRAVVELAVGPHDGGPVVDVAVFTPRRVVPTTLMFL